MGLAEIVDPGGKSSYPSKLPTGIVILGIQEEPSGIHQTNCCDIYMR